MDSEKLVEMVADEIKRRVPIDYGMRIEEARTYARAAVRIVVEECAKKAAVASLGTLKTTSDRIDRAIRALAPDTEEK